MRAELRFFGRDWLSAKLPFLFWLVLYCGVAYSAPQMCDHRYAIPPTAPTATKTAMANLSHASKNSSRSRVMVITQLAKIHRIAAA